MIKNIWPFLLLAHLSPAAESIQFKTLLFEPVQVRTNLLANSGFEQTNAAGFPSGWNWERRNTDAVCVPDRAHAHRGRQSLWLTNGTAFGAHVYATLWAAQPVRLLEGQPYTMSLWVKSEAPGLLNLIGGGDWQFRVQARPTAGEWQRLWKTFTPGVWMDDVKLDLSRARASAGRNGGGTSAFLLRLWALRSGGHRSRKMAGLRD